MNKKIVATAIACVLGTSCLFAVAACSDVNNDGDNGGNKTVQVTAEQWTEAFNKTKNTTNFTAKITNDYKASEAETFKEVQNFYFAESSFACDMSYKTNEVDEAAKIYAEKDSGLWYIATYAADSTYWYVSTSQSNSDYMRQAYGALTAYYSTSAQSVESATLDKLYSSFTYSDGVYKAKLYEQYNPDYASQSFYDVEVKVNESGYVSYIKISSTENHESSTVTMSSIYAYSDFGSTTVAENAEAKKEITDYKAENSKS